jgi:predicted nucleotide-binding protein
MQGQDAIRRIRRQADRLRTLDVIDSRAPAFMRWFRETSTALEEIFGAGKGPSREFQLTIFQPLTVSKYDPDFDYRNAYEKGVPIAFSFFDSVIKDLVEDPGRFASASGSPGAASPASEEPAAAKAQVLVLSGADEDAGAALSRCLESLGAAPSIAAEPKPGVSPVDRLRSASPAFGVVVLAPAAREGAGGRKRAGSGSLRPSPARMFELGYLLGRLGPKKVCALLPDGVELPFDVPGAAVVPFDGGGAWKTGLAKAMADAGLSVSEP